MTASYVSDSSNSSESVSHTPKKKTRRYRAEKIAGTGSFGTVYIARVVLEDDSLGARVAIKRVLQDKRYKVRTPLFLCYVFTLMKSLWHSMFFRVNEMYPDFPVFATFCPVSLFREYFSYMMNTIIVLVDVIMLFLFLCH